MNVAAEIALLSAPSNLGLRPPVPGSVPGAAKAPESLREAGLFQRFATIGAQDAGVVLPGRYVDDDSTRAPGHVRNERALLDHARRLAERITALLDKGATPLVVGGDCSILIGIGLALARRGDAGLVHIDGHTDFRHPANSDACASVAGEDLAAVTGFHWPALASIDGLGPYFPPARTVHIGHRAGDEHIAEVRARLGLALSADEAITMGAAGVAAAVKAVTGAVGYWIQLDVDVLDPSVMPAVDSPDPGGFTAAQLAGLLKALAPTAIGASVTVFDPDLDPDGRYARLVRDIVFSGFSTLGTNA